MKSLLVPLAGVFLLAAAGAAIAAPPEYCALYAREYANQFALAAGEKPGSEQRIQDEAYYRCLNMDQEPAMPAASAYSDLPTGTAGQGGPLEPVPGATSPAPEDAAASAGNAAPAAAAPSPKPLKKTADSTPPKRGFTSGKPAGTPEWAAWCRRYFPNSFDETNGTIRPFGSTKRQPCK